VSRGAPTGLRDLLRADFVATRDLDPLRPPGRRRTLDVLTQPGFLTLVVYRLGAAAHRRGHRVAARLLLHLNLFLFGCEIHPQAVIGPGAALVHPHGVCIAAGVVIGRDVRIWGLVRLGAAGYGGDRPDGFPVIGDGCRLYDHAMVFGPVEVGDGCKIGANALVLRSLPPGSVVRTPAADQAGAIRGPALGPAAGRGVEPEGCGRSASSR
jgi:serine O-acetyltransferase